MNQPRTTAQSGGRWAIHDARYGTVSAIAVNIIWGLSFVAARIALSTLTPVLLATIRFSIASILYTPIIINDLKRRGSPKLRDFLEFTLLGFLSISTYFPLQYTGVKYTGAGIASLLVVGLIPVITGIISSILLKERLDVKRMLGIVLGLSGIALVTLPGLYIGNIDLLFYLGVACLLLNAVCWSLYSTLSRRLMGRMKKPSVVTAYVTILGTLALFPMSITSDWNLIRSIQPDQWLSIIYLSTVCSGLGYFLWNFALSKVETVRAAVWTYLEPIAAFTGEALIFRIIPSPMTLVGASIIIVGAILTNR